MPSTKPTPGDTAATDLFSELGDRVAALRKERNFTQADLAKRVGISDTFVSNIENKSPNISSLLLLRLTRALDTSLDYLMLGSKSSRSPLGRSGARSFPSALEKVAEEEGWPFTEALILLEAAEVAQARSRGPRAPTGQAPSDLTTGDWFAMHQVLIRE